MASAELEKRPSASMIAHSAHCERRRSWTEDRLTGRLPVPRGKYMYYAGRPPASPHGSLRRQPAHGPPTRQPSLTRAGIREMLRARSNPPGRVISCPRRHPHPPYDRLHDSSTRTQLVRFRYLGSPPSGLAGRDHGLHWMTKTQRNYNGPVLALSSAFLFGASTPIANCSSVSPIRCCLPACFIWARVPASHWSQREAVRSVSAAPRHRCA